MVQLYLEILDLPLELGVHGLFLLQGRVEIHNLQVFSAKTDRLIILSVRS